MITEIRLFAEVTEILPNSHLKLTTIQEVTFLVHPIEQTISLKSVKPSERESL